MLNLCYVDSAEQIVYDRLLTRLVQAGSIVGTQQISMLPVTLEEFQELAEGRLSEVELERRAQARITLVKQRTASMELPPSDLYEIYARLGHNGSSGAVPVNLDMIRKTLTKDGEFFWQVMKDIEEVLQGRNQLSIASLPTEIMQRIGPLLLFPAQIPTLGVKASMTAPLPLLRAAIDAGCRVADAMKVRRAELQTASVQARLQREIERELAALHT